MTPEGFAEFRAMYEARYGRLKDGQWSELLGVHRDTMTAIKQRGVPIHSTVFRLAFSALWHNLDEWKGESDE